MKLKLNKDINPDFVRFKVQRRIDAGHFPDKHFHEVLVNTYIHEHSNYERLMWSLWKKSKKYAMSELENLLMQIATLDEEVTWECHLKLENYERTYESRNARSQHVISANDDYLMGFIGRVA